MSKTVLYKIISELKELALVEEVIKSSFRSDAASLSEISSYLFSLGGKRIRPVLCLLAYKALVEEEVKEQLITIAAGIELIHMATLLHDDIIDKSNLRRNSASANKKFGLAKSLLTGDFLLVRAFGLCAKLSSEIVRATEIACVELTEGEILELPMHEFDHDLDSSLLIARKKTASLFRLAGFCSCFFS